MSQFIVVLAYPRTGSSLCMQTLKLLGAHVAGEAKRPDLDIDGNPKGYYEDMRVLGKGLNAQIINEYQAIKAHNIAFKLSYAPLHPNHKRTTPEQQVAFLKQLSPRFILTVREPLESIMSVQRWSDSTCPKEQFIRITQKLKKYKENIETILKVLHDNHWLNPNNCLVQNYHDAIQNPTAYVERLADFAGLAPSHEQIASARANIDPALFRYKAKTLPANVVDWDSKIGASATYERLIQPLLIR
ncbi:MULTISPECIES: sulfotransferase [Idiomarina]|uniref:sulfotransferase n=1 Tax=Idiomarina TaxID=135575 RepID=UPI001E3E7DB7|nr:MULTISPECIES: sulfotransferase [Idiomarina]